MSIELANQEYLTFTGLLSLMPELWRYIHPKELTQAYNIKIQDLRMININLQCWGEQRLTDRLKSILHQLIDIYNSAIRERYYLYSTSQFFKYYRGKLRKRYAHRYHESIFINPQYNAQLNYNQLKKLSSRGAGQPEDRSSGTNHFLYYQRINICDQSLREKKRQSSIKKLIKRNPYSNRYEVKKHNEKNYFQKNTEYFLKEQVRAVEEVLIQELRNYSLQEIQHIVNNSNPKTLQATVSSTIVNEVKELISLERNLQQIQIKPEKKDFPKKNKKANIDVGIAFGVKKKQEEKNKTFDIRLGVNETLETRMEKKLLKQKAERNFAKEKQNEATLLSEEEQAARNITYFLNRMTPENLQQTVEELKPYALRKQCLCLKLVDVIIDKCWVQAKYADTYAELCKQLCQFERNEFQFPEPLEKNKKKYNSFKLYFIDRLNIKFVSLFEREVNFDPLDDFARTAYKKELMGITQFLGQLKKKNILLNGVIRDCMAHYLAYFIHQCYKFHKESNHKYSLYGYIFEALLRLVETLGNSIDFLNKKSSKDDKFASLMALIKDYCDFKKYPQNPDEIAELSANIHVNQYFDIFELIDQKILKVNDLRLSVLLLNLTQKRKNEWKQHHAENQAPQKLQQLRKQQEVQTFVYNEEYQEKIDHEITSLLRQKNAKNPEWEKTFKALVDKFYLEYVYVGFIRVCSNGTISQIVQNLTFFDHLLENGFNLAKFNIGWKTMIKCLTADESDIPYCSTVLAKVMIKIHEKFKMDWKEYYETVKVEDVDDDEAEEEKYFLQLVFKKIYHYKKIDEILKFVQQGKNLKKLL